MKIGGFYHHPTFFYESVGCLIIFIILLIVRRLKNVKIGIVSSIYLILYGLLRFFIEGLRQDSLMLFNIKMAQCVSIFSIVAGIGLLVYSIKDNRNYN